MDSMQMLLCVLFAFAFIVSVTNIIVKKTKGVGKSENMIDELIVFMLKCTAYLMYYFLTFTVINFISGDIFTTTALKIGFVLTLMNQYNRFGDNIEILTKRKMYIFKTVDILFDFIEGKYFKKKNDRE